MRTTITVPDSLFREVQRDTGGRNASKTILAVLKDYLRRKKIRRLLSMAGKVKLDIDQDKLRALRDSR
jgi:Arc/MetJ family transcription regulator